MKQSETRWSLALPPSRALHRQVMQNFNVSPMLAQVLCARGQGVAQLRPELSLSPNPALHRAASELAAAIKAGKRIRVHGDYDADGVTATAVLVLGLKALGANVHGFIPHRLEEGYGLHPDKLEEHAEAADLLLTVDCGVSNVAEVAALLAHGTQVIVTDHHAPGPDFPDCLVVHPHLTPGYDPSIHNLSGAGVAYHLLWALHQHLDLPAPTEYADLATIGIIADVAPLTGENRALVQAGLYQLRDSQHLGLRALMDSVKRTKPSARDVAFLLAPRLNAAGRMGEADLALELLTTSEAIRAQALTQHLETRNLERKAIQERMFDEALKLANPNDPAIVVTHPGWHAGVMGVVASKLLETHFKPVYIIAQGKGSVRSTPGISAVEGLREVSALLKRYGGHSGAAGFSIDEANLDAFTSGIHAYAARHPRPVSSLHLDAPLPAALASRDLALEMESFEPYGEGHRPPLWWLRTPLRDARRIGSSGRSMSFKADHLRGVMFNAPNLPGASEQDLTAELKRSFFRERESVELEAQGFRDTAPLGVEGVSPETSLLPRLNPREAMLRLKTGASAYAEGAVAAYLQENVPALSLVSAEDDCRGEVLLYALPPEDSLRRWLDSAKVSFAFGPKTLAELQGGERGLRLPANPDAALDVYRRWQWAELYAALDDASWSAAVYALLGLPTPLTAAVAADD